MIKDKAFVEAVIDRMKHVIGVTKDSELAEFLGAHRTGPAVWKSRPSLPINDIIKLALQQNVSLDWLIFGRGSPSYTGGGVNNLGGDEEVTEEKEIAETALLPVFDLAAPVNIENPATYWRIAVGWLHGEGLSEADGDTLLVRAASDSMEPTIKCNQLIAIDRRPVDIDGVFLIRLGESLRFKRVQRMIDGSIRLTNDNKAYAEEVLTAAAASNLEIIGFCVTAFSRVS